MNATSSEQHRVPTTVFSGFLGSGKTTIISHLIDTLQANGTKVAYIKNEIGDTDIDSKLMKGKDIETKELLNGCICCTLVGPFASAVSELITSYHPDRIIIEASGAADPSAIALMINSHPELTRDGIISIVDVENFEGYKDLSVTAQNQTQFTDLIIFNKVEMVPLDRKKAVVGYVRELNTHSPIIEAPAGTVDPEVVFGLDPKHLEPFILEHAQHKHTHAHTQNHIQSDHFEAFTLKSPQPISEEKVRSVLETLPKPIFRTKGIFLTPEGKWLSYNGVGKKVTIEPVEDATSFNENIFVFIGVDADQFQNDIQKNLLG
ncbi:MAG: GTP-binding protein [Pseudomonadales bacterium]|nr:GTP-binding protein [Candidatus Woesebacteria bacterium]MCB9801266.1 GTP-binding protein [Pseudomonadales bacterium]